MKKKRRRQIEKKIIIMKNNKIRKTINYEEMENIIVTNFCTMDQKKINKKKYKINVCNKNTNVELIL